MSIATQITRLQGVKTDIRNALVEQGIDEAIKHNMDDFAQDILDISGGGEIGIRVTIYSAVKDTIYYYENNDTSQPRILCVTDEKGKGVGTIFVGDLSSVVLYSNVAKDINDKSKPFSKSFNVSELTNDLYLMPNGLIGYWYGYTPYTWANAKPTSIQNDGSATFNLNSVTFKNNLAHLHGVLSYSEPSIDVSNYTKIRTIISNSSTPVDAVISISKTSVNFLFGSYGYTGYSQAYRVGVTKDVLNYDGLQNTSSSFLREYTNPTVYALWLE